MKDIGTKGETNQVFHREVSILTLSELKILQNLLDWLAPDEQPSLQN
jgi:hypothetical protein